jgi:glycosyltransferase involved in cell wall biosynthesis
MKKKKKAVATISAMKQPAKPLISVCMIARNEEKNIDRCLRSVKPVADEIILVDTGSTDRTVEIARKYTDKVYYHPWNDNFSEARNQAMSYATGDWILTIDADEELAAEDIPNVLEAAHDAGIDAIIAQVVNIAQKGQSRGVLNSERFLLNNGVIHYEGRVHNRVVGVASPGIYRIRIYHYGYDALETDIGKKFARTVSLLKKDLDDNPDNPATHHYLSCSYLSRGMNRETIVHGLEAVRLSEAGNNRDVMFLWTRYNISLAYYRLQDLKLARETALAALKGYPDHIDSHFMMIVICFDEKCWQELIYHADRYLRLVEDLNADPAGLGLLVTCSLNEAWNMYVLTGIAHAELGRGEDSRRSFAEAVRSAPEPFLALRAIGIFYYNKNLLAQSRVYLERAQQQKSDDEKVNELLKNITASDTALQKEPTISCCMIVKDEEAFLATCLESIKDFVDEIIIVDTGSVDKTVEIAGRYTEKVHFHPWRNSFSEARNHAMSFAAGDWILTIDADEELVAGSGERLRQAVREAGAADAISASVISIYSGGRKTARHNSERLLRNNGVIRYEGSVHNRVTGVTKTARSRVELMHYGYNVEEKKANEKFIRTVELLKKEILSTPEDPRLHHYLGTSYLARGMYRESIEESTLALRLAESRGNRDVFYLSTHYNSALAFCRLREFRDARDCSLAALAKYPDHLDSLHMMTILAAEDKDWENVLHYGRRFLALRADYESNPEKSGVMIGETIGEGYPVHLLAGHACHALTNHEQMERHYRAAYEMAKDKWRNWWDIAIFHLDHSGDLKLSRKYLELALAEALDEPAVWYMLAKCHSKMGNGQDEMRCLWRLFELGAHDTVVLNRLAHLSIFADDLTKAEQALDALQKIDPQNHEAWCSRGLLCRRQNSPEAAMAAFGMAVEIDPAAAAPWFHLGEIAMQLGQLDSARSFFEHVRRLDKGALKALLLLCEIELRQSQMVAFVDRCDLLLKELRLNRGRTIHSVEDLSGILHEIHTDLIHDSELSSQVSKILSLLPGSRH